MNEEEVSLMQLSMLLDRLASPISIAFGPLGKNILINKKSPKTLNITKDGLELCETLESESPLYKLIVKILRDYRNRRGDGIKTIVLLLRNYLRIVSSYGKKTEINKSLLMVELGKLRRDFLPSLHETLIHYSITTKQIRANGPSGLENEKMDNIIHTILSSRLKGKAICKTLTNFLKAYTKESTGGIPNISINFTSRTLLVYNREVSQSRIEKSGFYISNKLSLPQLLPSHSHPSKFLIWKHEDEDDEFQEINFQIDHQMNNLSELILLRSKKAEKLVQKFVNEFNISLVVSNFELPQYFKNYCERYGLNLVERVDIEEISDLAKECDLMTWSPEEDHIDPRLHLGNIDGFEQVLLGADDVYTKIKISDKTIIHPIICGPTKDLARQYFKICVDVLKTISLSSIEKVNNSILPVGNFELIFWEHLTNNKGEVYDDLANAVLNLYNEFIKPTTLSMKREEGIELIESKMAQLDCFLDIAINLFRIGNILRISPRHNDRRCID